MAKKKNEETAAEENQEQEKKQGGNTMKMILMIGVPIMLVQAGLAWFLISSFAQPTKAVSEEQTETEAASDPGKPGILFEFKDVIINPAGTAGSRFLNATIVLEFTESGLESEITDKSVQVRDAMVNILVIKTSLELDGALGRENIKHEIKEVCNSNFKKGKIRAVYLPIFIFQ